MKPVPQNQRDARVEKLWAKLDTKQEGALDLNALKKGLAKIDHPLKNADPLLRDIMKAVDTNGDGRIQYEEFRVFVEETEKELWKLFNNIDRDHNGNLDKRELQFAFSRAGLAVPSSKLDRFFEQVDTDHDGVISFEEWRNFLLFMPMHTPNLKAVMSYYSSTVTLNSDSDVALGNETVESLGKPSQFHQVVTVLYIKIKGIFMPQKKDPIVPPQDSGHLEVLDKRNLAESNIVPVLVAVDAVDRILLSADMETSEAKLTQPVFQPGYFIAGGVAGVISRSVTAPLDRLKVYLIAQTDNPKLAAEAIANAAPKKAVKHMGASLIEASKALWGAGGVRNLFVGNGVNVIKVMPESAIKFGSYEASKRLFARLEGHSDPEKLQPLSKFVAGGLGGIISQFAVYPIDTLKFRMQSETVKGGLSGNALVKESFRRVWTQSGIRGFYRGLPMGLVGMFPYSAIDLNTFEFLKHRVAARNARKMGCHEEDAAPGGFTTAIIGGFSGAFGASIVYPLNLLRTRLQVQGTAQHPPTYTGVWDVTMKTVQKEGVRGLFKGITPNLLKVVPAVSITYVVYEKSKQAMNLH